jgi:hypothetical protein
MHKRRPQITCSNKMEREMTCLMLSFHACNNNMRQQDNTKKQGNNQFCYFKVGILYSKPRNFIRGSLDCEWGDTSKFIISSSFTPTLFTHIRIRWEIARVYEIFLAWFNTFTYEYVSKLFYSIPKQARKC